MITAALGQFQAVRFKVLSRAAAVEASEWAAVARTRIASPAAATEEGSELRSKRRKTFAKMFSLFTAGHALDCRSAATGSLEPTSPGTSRRTIHRAITVK